VKWKLRGHWFSIRYKLLVSFLVFIMLPLMITMLVYYESSIRLLIREVNQTNAEALANLSGQMNAAAERFVKASHLLVNDPEVLELIRNGGNLDLSDYGTFQKYKGVSKKLSNIRDFLLEREAYIAVFDFNGHMYTTWTNRNTDLAYKEFQQASWFQRTRMEMGTPVWQIVDTDSIENDYIKKKLRLFMMTRLIRDDAGNESGIVMIGIPVEAVLPEIAADPAAEQLLPEAASQLLLLQNDDLLSGSEDLFNRLSLDTVGQDITTRDGYLINRSVVKQMGWELLRVTPQAQFTDHLQKLQNRSIVWLIGFSLILCISFILIMFKVISPLKILHRSMVKVGSGNFTSIANIKGNDEIAMLSHKFNDMVLNLRKLIERLSEEQKRKEEARFQALQAQVKPHFLFNTLNSIKWSASLSGAEHVSDMITSLGLLLNYAMKNDNEFTILREELVFLQNYVHLQNIRFDNEVSLEIHVPEELLEASILKFTLQPLVENSILHGKRSNLIIVIEAKTDGEDLQITVRDNGYAALARQSLDFVEDNPLTSSKFSGIGLNNINDRLKMHFGEAYGLMFETSAVEGFIVTIRLPFHNRRCSP
jgi:two-component system, sensor histidine kinase YesM